MQNYELYFSVEKMIDNTDGKCNHPCNFIEFVTPFQKVNRKSFMSTVSMQIFVLNTKPHESKFIAYIFVSVVDWNVKELISGNVCYAFIHVRNSMEFGYQQRLG